MATITMGMNSTILNATKTWNSTDADMQDVLNWGATAYNKYIQATFNPNNTPGFVPTNMQIGAAIANMWMASLKQNVQDFKTSQPVTPPPMGWV